MGVERKRSPAYPKELTYPCCRQALGELGELSPHGGPETKCTPIGRGPMSLEASAGLHHRIG
jgi:hypothetical protein